MWVFRIHRDFCAVEKQLLNMDTKDFGLSKYYHLIKVGQGVKYKTYSDNKDVVLF